MLHGVLLGLGLGYFLYMMHTNIITWLIDGSRSKVDDCMHPPILNPEQVLGGSTPQCTNQTHELEPSPVATQGIAIQCNGIVCLRDSTTAYSCMRTDVTDETTLTCR